MCLCWNSKIKEQGFVLSICSFAGVKYPVNTLIGMGFVNIKFNDITLKKKKHI